MSLKSQLGDWVFCAIYSKSKLLEETPDKAKRIKHLQEKQELQTDYVISGQIQHKCLKIQEYCLDFYDKQQVGAM